MLTRRHDTGRTAPAPAPSLPRCALVETTATLVAGVLLRLLVPDLVRAQDLLRGGVPFDALVADGAALVLAVCVAWGWITTTAVVVEALTGVRLRRDTCPRAVRRAVLLACGIALVAGAAPATAAPGGSDDVGHARGSGDEDRSILAGLPMPDRPVGPARRSVAPTQVLAARVPHDPVAPPVGEVLVRPGDTLWNIARSTLPTGAGPDEVTRHWHRIWEANRDAIGPDPDLIRPGTTLRLPPRKDA